MDERRKWTVHPVYPDPSGEEVLEEARRKGVKEEEAERGLRETRERVIGREGEDPLRWEWEPDAWKIADALLGWELFDARFDLRLREAGLSWDEFCGEVRRRLGFKEKVKWLLLMGANRSAKSSWAAKRMQERLCGGKDQEVFCLDMNHDHSVREQQRLVWRYMPRAWRMAMRRTDTNIQYSEKNGFTNGDFINPLGSYCKFLCYTQDLSAVSEGRQPHRVWMDELAPAEWVETWGYRLATRGGSGCVTFTPLDGYSPLVAGVCDGGQVTMDWPAFLLPIDGKGPALYAGLGLAREEHEEVVRARGEGRQSRWPATRGMDVLEWLRLGDGYEKEMMGAYWPELRGRGFARVPRVMRSANPLWGVVWFHGCDNPFGGAENVMAEALHSRKGSGTVKVRCYGFAEKTTFGTFRKFERSVHVMKRDAVPEGGENTLLVDPHTDRNWAMVWVRNTGLKRVVYREWPSRVYRVPGVGVMEPWAMPSATKLDGVMGEGQKNLGWGYGRYKFEMARLEGWRDYELWLRENCEEGECSGEEGEERVLRGEWYPGDGELMGWTANNGAREVVGVRLIDPRACQATSLKFGGGVTLLSELEGVGLDFWPARGGRTTGAGVDKVNALLDYEERGGGGFVNEPHLVFSDGCENVLFAVENWRGVDGEKGATKDWIDLLRWEAMREEGLTMEREETLEERRRERDAVRPAGHPAGGRIRRGGEGGGVVWEG